MDKWIPVSERLPEEEKEVLVCSDFGYIDVAMGSYLIKISSHPWIWYISERKFGNVIAWMPLPEPYNSDLK